MRWNMSIIGAVLSIALSGSGAAMMGRALSRLGPRILVNRVASGCESSNFDECFKQIKIEKGNSLFQQNYTEGLRSERPAMPASQVVKQVLDEKLNQVVTAKKFADLIDKNQIFSGSHQYDAQHLLQVILSGDSSRYLTCVDRYQAEEGSLDLRELLFAVFSNNFVMVSYVLSRMSFVRVAGKLTLLGPGEFLVAGEDGWTPLHWATLLNVDHRIIEQLLQAGYSVAACDENGITPHLIAKHKKNIALTLWFYSALA